VQPGSFDFDRDVNLPVSGRTPAARQASATGAQHAAIVRSVHMRRLLRAFLGSGRLTIAEASALTGIKEGTVCSVWSRLEKVEWITGTETFRSYQSVTSGREVRQEYHTLTARGRDVAQQLEGEATCP
jgi:hypothetical protein